MKKLLFIIVLITITFQAIGQNYESVTQKIDESEKWLTDYYGKEWYSRTGNNYILDFYDALENGTNHPRFNELMYKAEGFKNKLKYSYVTFIIDGWLYVMSYEPNTDADKIVRVYLYRKDVKTLGNVWEKANGNPVFTNAKIEEGIFFLPSKGNEGSAGNAIKLPAYKNVVLIICGTIKTLINNPSRYFNRFIVLSPQRISPNGSIYFDVSVNCGDTHYPMSFTGIQDGGKIVNTVDNNGQKQNIKIMLGGYDPDTKSQLNETIVSFDGDYGWSIAYE